MDGRQKDHGQMPEDGYTILKRKSFATLLKCRFLLYDPNNSFGDNAIGKPRYLACIQHEKQNGVACGCPASTIILRPTPFCKVTKLQYLKLYHGW